MIRQFAALGLSTFIRLLTAFVLFVLLAREWGAGQFGEFMYLFSVAALLVLACEYGFSQQILRDIGRDPDSAGQRMAGFLGAKVWLTLGVALAGVVFVVTVDLTIEVALGLALLMLAATMMSYSDCLMACFRALGQYDKEAKVTFWGNLTYFVFAVIALAVDSGASGVALAMTLGRLGHLVLAFLSYRRLVPFGSSIQLSPRKAWYVIRDGMAYGMDVGVATAFVYLDAVLLGIVLNFESVGVYQAGARFYQGAALLPPIFAGVFLPRLARAVGDRAIFESLVRKLYWSSGVTAVLIAIGFSLSVFGVHLIYPDPSLALVGVLMPWFGLLVLIRFIAASQGITVTALGGQMVRAKLFLVALLIMVITSIPLMESHGPKGMIFAMCIAYLILSAGFWVWTERKGVSARLSLGLSLSIFLGAVPLIWNLTN